mmetsp:Transcript_67086/g.199499  ORF Transcript_67086/g.199499 Transcript_67086/m.199499 type:complete len:414 (-) Transcript_67086:434-1675(-)
MLGLLQLLVHAPLYVHGALHGLVLLDDAHHLELREVVLELRLLLLRLRLLVVLQGAHAGAVVGPLHLDAPAHLRGDLHVGLVEDLQEPPAVLLLVRIEAAAPGVVVRLGRRLRVRSVAVLPLLRPAGTTVVGLAAAVRVLLLQHYSAALIQEGHVPEDREALPVVRIQRHQRRLLLLALVEAQDAKGEGLLELLNSAPQRDLLRVLPRVFPTEHNDRQEHVEYDDEHNLEDGEDKREVHRRSVDEVVHVKPPIHVEEEAGEGWKGRAKPLVLHSVAEFEQADETQRHDQEDDRHDRELVEGGGYRRHHEAQGRQALQVLQEAEHEEEAVDGRQAEQQAVDLRHPREHDEGVLRVDVSRRREDVVSGPRPDPVPREEDAAADEHVVECGLDDRDVQDQAHEVHEVPPVLQEEVE